MVVCADQVIAEVARFRVEDSDKAPTGAVGENSLITPLLEIGTLALMEKEGILKAVAREFAASIVIKIARNCWASKRRASRGRSGKQAERFQNRVFAVGNALADRQQEEERETAGASGNTANEINAIFTRGHRASPFHRMRIL